MSIPRTRDELIQYCLRRLGHPVIEINVDIEQVEDRIDDAFDMFAQYHVDATEHVVVPTVITAQDIVNKAIPLPAGFTAITNVLTLGNGSVGGGGMFDIQYQIRLTEWDAFFAGGSIMSYDIMQQHLALLQFEFGVNYSYSFNSATNDLTIQWNWGTDVHAGDYVIIEGYRKLDPTTNPGVYSIIWLRQYATELIRRQWGANLMKYLGTTLPGGITINGQAIFDEANTAIDKLEQELMNTWQEPVDFMIG